jgi:outer membrane lipase/esterase
MIVQGKYHRAPANPAQPLQPLAPTLENQPMTSDSSRPVTPRARRRRSGLAALAVAALSAMVAACGGGTQTTVFVPTRVLAFGDESSVIDTTGRKYTVNGVSTTNPGAVDCAVNPIWVQTVATARYGLVFPECNPNNVANPASRILATPQARVADVVRQVDAQLAAGGFRGSDLSLVMAGANDVIDAAGLFPATPVPTLVAQVTEAGRLLGLQVNRMADGGSRVIVSTIVDLTWTPFGRSRADLNTVVDCPRVQGESERLPLITCLVDRYNGALRTTFYNDGRRVGLVLADVLVRTYVQFPAVGGFNNVSDAACAPSAVLPSCTTATLSGPDRNGILASASSWLWADATRLSAGGHAQLGSSAASRAVTNPF